MAAVGVIVHLQVSVSLMHVMPVTACRTQSWCGGVVVLAVVVPMVAEGREGNGGDGRQAQGGKPQRTKNRNRP